MTIEEINKELQGLKKEVDGITAELKEVDCQSSYYAKLWDTRIAVKEKIKELEEKSLEISETSGCSPE